MTKDEIAGWFSHLGMLAKKRGYDEGFRDGIEAAAKIAEVGADNQEAWDWSKLPAVIRALAASTVTAPEYAQHVCDYRCGGDNGHHARPSPSGTVTAGEAASCDKWEDCTGSAGHDGPCSLFGGTVNTGTGPYEAQIKRMVNRFLSWRLPESFRPDGGIRFKPHPLPNCWPSGTNLFDATQAEAMVRHMFAIEVFAKQRGDAKPYPDDANVREHTETQRGERMPLPELDCTLTIEDAVGIGKAKP